MEKYFNVIKASFLFKNADEKTIKLLLSSCGYKITSYKKDEIILLCGTHAHNIGIILSGRAFAQKNTASGRSFTVANISEGGIFGDILAGSNVLSPVTVTAQSDCIVLLLPFSALMSKGAFVNGAHIVLQNLVSAIADKYFMLDARIDLILEKSLRTRILLYLKEKAADTGSFSHKMTRQQLADYLGCERAALCRELSRMKLDGIINYDRHSFVIL